MPALHPDQHLRYHVELPQSPLHQNSHLTYNQLHGLLLLHHHCLQKLHCRPHLEISFSFFLYFFSCHSRHRYPAFSYLSSKASLSTSSGDFFFFFPLFFFLSLSSSLSGFFLSVFKSFIVDLIWRFLFLFSFIFFLVTLVIAIRLFLICLFITVRIQFISRSHKFIVHVRNFEFFFSFLATLFALFRFVIINFGTFILGF